MDIKQDGNPEILGLGLGCDCGCAQIGCGQIGCPTLNPGCS